MSAKMKLGTFHVLQDLPTSYKNILNLVKDERNEALSWGSESDIQGFVKLAMSKVIRMAGLASQIKCLNELGIFRSRADVWLVISKSMPIGVIEVKKPSRSIMSDPKLHGQFIDYEKTTVFFWTKMDFWNHNLLSGMEDPLA